MAYRPVNSSAIQGVDYSSKDKTLEVFFTNGDNRVYFDVPREVYQAFMKSSSKGAFFNYAIRDHYSYS